MVSSGKSTIYDDQRAMPESSAGTKAREETFTYDDDTYEEADTKDWAPVPTGAPKWCT